jgi:hypothetical protein
MHQTLAHQISLNKYYCISTDRTQHNNCGRLQYPTLTNGRVVHIPKINKETSELINTINQMDLTHVYRIFHPAAAQYTFVTEAHGTFSKIDNILGHKQVLANIRKPK